MEHRAGFVNIIGYPNAGKSTLMNLLMEENLSVVTNKAQTTRHRILGMINNKDHQVIFSDTPGIIRPSYKLQESMMRFVNSSFEDADLLIWLIDGTSGQPEADLISKIQKLKIPVLILINKTDLATAEAVDKHIAFLTTLFPKADCLPVSAINKKYKSKILSRILKHIPQHPPYFPKDQMTDKPERFFVSEIIRGKILTQYKQEIPYSIEVVVESFKEEEKIIRIRAVIFTNRKTQKPILIGKGGQSLKKVGIAARKDMEEFFGKQVYLELFVKVKENWRNDPNQLKYFGYNI